MKRASGRGPIVWMCTGTPVSSDARQIGSQSGCQSGSMSCDMPSSAPPRPSSPQRRSSSAALSGCADDKQPMPAKRPGAFRQNSASQPL